MATESTTRFRIEGMDCASCAAKVDTAARRVTGVTDVTVSVTAQTMAVVHGDGTDLTALADKVTKLGYRATRMPPKETQVNSEGHAQSDGDERSGCCDHHDQDHNHDHNDHHGHDHGDHDHGSHKSEAHNHVHEVVPPGTPWWRTSKAQLMLASGVALLVAMIVAHLIPAVAFWVYCAAIAVGIVPIARRAVMAALAGTPFSIEMLMTIASVGAVFIGATQEAATVVFLFLVGELLEGFAAGRARASIQGLTKLVPDTARIENNGRLEEVPADSLKVGMIVTVRPGDRIPADGEIVKGESAINEAPVTGESIAKTKSVGAAVFAGTVNGDGVIAVRVTAAASDNTIARVVRLVEEAQEVKAPTERFIDRFSRYYTPAVTLVAALVAVLPPLFAGGDWSEWLYKGLAILLIGCPCALVISTPAAIAAGLSAGARRGLLMKGGAVLESVGRITAIALDKTGTLTEGKPKVTEIIPLGGATEADVLKLAAALEAQSSHPLARAILDEAAARKYDLPAARETGAIAGKGVRGKVGDTALFLGSAAAAEERAELPADVAKQIDALSSKGKSVSVLVRDDGIIGLIALRDEPRADAVAGLNALKAAGIKPIMLTGDNAATAKAIGGLLDIETRYELLPQDKQEIVRALQARGERVAKVGDGINDAPALAAADVGIAMGGGTDVALETADAAILHGRVLDLADMVLLSRRVMANIHQNITIAIGLKVVFLVTTVIGVTGLWPAILADTGATVLVTANAMRLLAWRGGKSET
ncbi:heavy metal translocating P-type ATPase [Allorhizobium taibaishanense]|uniref:P-type Zn(2+) transporter n=1 Tax=Allorhizobium taibaishanense TaxID=887144 RepID=A0A1Q9A6Q8_9HYPH|nr:heavy metal translocating P-type ATPase [Allorhizobium taibaishanense]MBB4008586.1 Cd2+/Zn2+-exporting ATPase [Allorhizobium taibaishanense]OLP50269.1 cadmium-translocating P-type ATPase [Allorhizobium taibaishanense]